ncbi:putative inactive poly [ADP-ribose] polymerase SRO2 [Tasmannia lanceolata]|uniref:putative inactive poly [ADP-ribose] polymerase SRO2 n=1 Tax=Tasmannia lanceolata TaxID=3420 RepID=UPI0040646A82
MEGQAENYVPATSNNGSANAAEVAPGGGKSVTIASAGPSRQPDRNAGQCLPSSCLAFLQNRQNYEKSAVPARLMFLLNDGWTDFSAEVFEILKTAFASGNGSTVVEIDGSTHLVDFLRMILIDLNSGRERSVAWIDVNGKCFFPKAFIDGDSGFDCPRSSKRALECLGETDSRKRVCLSRSSEFEMSRRRPTLDSMGRLLAKLSESDRSYIAVKDLFLAGMVKIDSRVKVEEIYSCSYASSMSSARFQAFERNVEMTKARRGDGNVRLAWHGASRKVVERLVLQGFGQVQARNGGNCYGIGIYLSPEELSFASASQLEPDDDDEKCYMVLCRVIMGKMEKITMWSHQFRPTDERFDSGVDDVGDPKCYVMWSMRMNTHILPEYVVSFSLSEHLRELLRRRSALNSTVLLQSHGGSLREILRSVPRPPFQAGLPMANTRPHPLFRVLLSVLRRHLPQSTMEALENLYNDYKASRIAKHDLIKAIRENIEDDILKPAIATVREAAGL